MSRPESTRTGCRLRSVFECIILCRLLKDLLIPQHPVRLMDRGADQRTDGRTNGPTGGPTDRRTNEWTNRPTDRPTDRRTEGPTYRLSNELYTRVTCKQNIYSNLTQSANYLQPRFDNRDHHSNQSKNDDDI